MKNKKFNWKILVIIIIFIAIAFGFGLAVAHFYSKLAQIVNALLFLLGLTKSMTDQ